MSGARHRRKGDRIERAIVAKHIEIGVHAERYPLSGATRFRNSGHDLELYIFGKDEAPLVAEVKARKNGGGFVQLRCDARFCSNRCRQWHYRRRKGAGAA